MLKYAKLIMTLALAIPLLFGCAANNYDNEARNNDNRVQNVRYNPPDRNRPTNQETRMEVAQTAADRVADLKEVSDANVIVANRTAYVAVILSNHLKGKMTKDVERKIANTVKQTDPKIDNVFVSTNPDFVERMADYSQKLQQGRPVSGLFEEFSEMVRRVFPTAR
ncbi:lipoprotein yhcN [Anoxybacillus sp. B7M1]|jgi:spore cortex protein|uniref:YhcN/YlaJ family sporulation lipoprotein n=1 Tax=Anoxybacteroides rupiense TaxID=311460 RepID=A0ABT5W313_9BACL|nr:MULTISPECIES: YhcN/YlaJ family sporulation lipoprotein [Anoxybacillus]ANB57257.1 lipoprotein yhcN [Anoxybacillus sp. B2M1]ANB63477.1 lipoprotein yhcN [Anoxybacillus sp. B7M1]KXG08911.1 Lipoprotein YhcN [Anoxybacillus sp. P3H1B]MBB3908116.1 YhcN/YlaJ family sporulation lipoprotein [Anoxybacillus rupiensis]MBS2772910.1 YhcN/YlaJ family sporulation lipoprotein [Anoxybacillus rupiensis]